jgi:negative regulator of sigma E activity
MVERQPRRQPVVALVAQAPALVVVAALRPQVAALLVVVAALAEAAALVVVAALRPLLRPNSNQSEENEGVIINAKQTSHSDCRYRFVGSDRAGVGSPCVFGGV